MTRAAIAILMLGIVGVVRADDVSLPRSLREVGFDQRLDEQVPLDLRFTDEAGREVALRDYFEHGKPVILVMAYFRCPQLCSEVLNGLVRGLLDTNMKPGTDFDVVVVSFDERETPAMAATKKKTYMERYGKAGAEDAWHFLTGRKEAIDALSKSVGFRFRYDARADQFAHASGIMILTPQGKIARYFYDIRYEPRDLRLALVEASANRIGSPVDQVLLYCFHYDPAEGRYGVTIMNFVRLGGVLTMAGIGTLLFVLWRGERRRAQIVTVATKTSIPTRSASEESTPPAEDPSLALRVGMDNIAPEK